MLIVCGHAWCLPFDVAAEAARPLDARDDAAAFWRDALVFKQIDTGMRKPAALALRCNGNVRIVLPLTWVVGSSTLIGVLSAKPCSTRRNLCSDNLAPAT